MKRLIVALMLAAILCTMIVPVSAEYTGFWNIEVSKATANVDGVLDEAYKTSGRILVDTTHFTWGSPRPGGEGNEEIVPAVSEMQATIFYLWDDEYVYVFVEAWDDDPVDPGDMIYMAVPNYWMADCYDAEWFLPTGEYFKVNVDAFGHCVTANEEPKNGAPFTDDQLITSTAITDKGWNIEVAIPLADYLEVDAVIETRAQVCDKPYMFGEDEATGILWDNVYALAPKDYYDDGSETTTLDVMLTFVEAADLTSEGFAKLPNLPIDQLGNTTVVSTPNQGGSDTDAPETNPPESNNNETNNQNNENNNDPSEFPWGIVIGVAAAVVVIGAVVIIVAKKKK